MLDWARIFLEVVNIVEKLPFHGIWFLDSSDVCPCNIYIFVIDMHYSNTIHFSDVFRVNIKRKTDDLKKFAFSIVLHYC